MDTEPKMNQFAIRREVVAIDAHHREVVFAETSSVREGQPELFRLAEIAMRQWPGKWKTKAIRAPPTFPPPWGGAPQSDEAYRQRVWAMAGLATRSGVLGVEHLGHVPAGWLPVLERAVIDLGECLRQSQHRQAVLKIDQIKEKFGTLRFYVSATGSRSSRPCLSQIATWAELCSENRCILTGMPGKLRRGDWMLTLSDPAVRLRDKVPRAFEARLYPGIG